MPLVSDVIVGESARLCIWQIVEQECDFVVPEKVDLSAIRSEARRCEILAIYALLHHMLGRSDLVIEHDKSGKPMLQGHHVSISHTKGWAALILSETQEVAVDIEYMSNRVARITERFIRPDEPADGIHAQLVNWSAKETVYKLLHKENLQYFEMRLRPYNLACQGSVEVEDLKDPKFVKVCYEVNADYVLTYVVGK